MRNVPFLIWDETTDELVPIAGVLEQVKAFDELGYRYEFDQFQAGRAPDARAQRRIRAGRRVPRDGNGRQPTRRTSRTSYNPTMDFAADGTTAGHAYWVYGVALRESSGTAPLGTVDVRSQGFGAGDPPPGATQHGAGALTGGQIPAIPYTSQSKAWGPAAERTGARRAEHRRDERRPP